MLGDKEVIEQSVVSMETTTFETFVTIGEGTLATMWVPLLGLKFLSMSGGETFGFDQGETGKLVDNIKNVCIDYYLRIV